MNRLNFYFLLLFVLLSFGCNSPATEADRLVISRIYDIQEAKRQIAANVWPGFDDAQYEVPLVYYTDSVCYVVNPEARFLEQHKATLIYADMALEIYTTPLLDTIPFHMHGSISLDAADAGSAYNYRQTYLHCSSPEITAHCIPDTDDIAVWRTMVLHEYFHGFQFMHPLWLTRFESSGACFVPSSKLQEYYREYNWYKELVDMENNHLLHALEASDPAATLNNIEEFRQVRAIRRERMQQELPSKTAEIEQVYETMEGTARYIEYCAYSEESDLAANSWLYRTDQSVYFYATGFNLVRLLGKLGVEYKSRLFSEGTALDELPAR